MVNLLPPKELRALRRSYYANLVSTSCLMLLAVSLLGAALLLPSYFLSRGLSEAALAYVSASEGSAALSAANPEERNLGSLKEQLSLLEAYDQKPLAALVFSNIAEHASGDIGVNSISLTYGEEPGEGRVTVHGEARTRAALIEFGKRLSEEALFRGASVPVSDLVTESNIEFSMTFSFVSEAR